MSSNINYKKEMILNMYNMVISSKKSSDSLMEAVTFYFNDKNEYKKIQHIKRIEIYWKINKIRVIDIHNRYIKVDYQLLKLVFLKLLRFLTQIFENIDRDIDITVIKIQYSDIDEDIHYDIYNLSYLINQFE